MLKRLHVAAGIIGLATIATFWTSTVIVDLFGTYAQIATVKQAILWGLLLLVPALAVAGASGMRMGGWAKAGPALAKKRRMPIIAANGLLVLVPCAIVLSARAQAGQFDDLFYAIQAVELAAGLVNMALLALNVRDGFRLTGRFAVRPARDTA